MEKKLTLGREKLITGKDKKDKISRKEITITEEQRSTHVQIIGSSGEGKSKLMEHMIREDIVEGRGLCFIDPHGYLFNDLVAWIAKHDFLKWPQPRKIVLFDPSNDNYTFGFNPLSYGETNISYHVDAMVKATAKVWGGEDTDKTPLLKRVLRILFHALAENNLTLLEAGLLLDPNDSRMRKYIAENVKDWIIRQQWEYFSELKSKQFYDECGSAINRIMEFLASQDIRNIIGQLEKTLDFKKIMDEGHILLVNLATSSKISDDNARLLGSLIINDLFLKARARQKGSRPFYLYIDECALFINEDIKRILDEGRKFGLHLILAHQHLAQLRKAGEDIYSAVMTDAKTKIIFGGLSAEDARVLTEQVFLGEIDLEEPKHRYDKLFIQKYTSRWFKSFSKGHAYSSGAGQSSSMGTTAIPESTSEIFTDDGTRLRFATSPGNNISINSSTDSYFSSDSESESEGMTEGLMPVFEKLPTTGFSLEEQIYRHMALMVNQPKRQAILKLPKQKTIIIETPFVKGTEEYRLTESEAEEYKIKCFELADFCQPRIIIENKINNRIEKLRSLIKGQNEKPLDNESLSEIIEES